MKKIVLEALRKSSGFTLIELLVVIGILGILAAALIAAINPIEQINKAHDSSEQSTAVEYIQGLQSYVTSHGYLPWSKSNPNLAVGCTTAPNAFDTTAKPYVSSLSSLSACTALLTNEGDLNSAFSNVSSTILDGIFLTPDTTGNNAVWACFEPSSSSFQHQATTDYNIGGGAGGATCISAGQSTPCYWCTE